jgi:hypothetical protein
VTPPHPYRDPPPYRHHPRHPTACGCGVAELQAQLDLVVTDARRHGLELPAVVVDELYERLGDLLVFLAEAP